MAGDLQRISDTDREQVA